MQGRSIFCGSQTATLAANTAAGGNWTGGLGTIQSDNTTANATYTPAPSESGTVVNLTWNIPDPDGEWRMYCYIRSNDNYI
jgi:hypothetical protein